MVGVSLCGGQRRHLDLGFGLEGMFVDVMLRRRIAVFVQSSGRGSREWWQWDAV
jgi:hypothetical protein